jgi:hypothetical protein
MSTSVVLVHWYDIELEVWGRFSPPSAATAHDPGQASEFELEAIYYGGARQRALEDGPCDEIASLARDAAEAEWNANGRRCWDCED